MQIKFRVKVMAEQLKLSNQICHRLYMANNAITRAYKPHLDELGITYPQYLVMMSLWQEDGVEVGDVRKNTQIDAGALTLILKKLTQKCLIELLPSEADKRVKLVQLTPSGHELKSLAQSIPSKLKCQFPEVASEDLAQLRYLLDKLNGSLNSN